MSKKSCSRGGGEGVDYPVNWGQYLDWFHAEQSCRNYLKKLLWSEGLVRSCPLRPCF